MRKTRGVFAALTAVAALGVTAAPALAVSDEQACTDAGGTFTKEKGTASCAFPVGNSDNTKTTSQKGSFESSAEETKTNPGGNQPPGQQGGDTLR